MHNLASEPEAGGDAERFIWSTSRGRRNQYPWAPSNFEDLALCIAERLRVIALPDACCTALSQVWLM